MSELSSSKIDKYEFFTDEEILPSNQQQITEQTKFTYSPLGKVFEKQIEDQGGKKVKALKHLSLKDQTNSVKGIFPKRNETNEIKDDLSKIKRHENKVIRYNFYYNLSKKPFDFRTFKIIRS